MKKYNNIKTGPLFLVYEAEDGAQFLQPFEDVATCGELLDPDTDEELEVVGWITDKTDYFYGPDRYMICVENSEGEIVEVEYFERLHEAYDRLKEIPDEFSEEYPEGCALMGSQLFDGGDVIEDVYW